MTDRANDRFWEDNFARDDSTTVGNNWSTSGAVQIVNQTLRQSGASSTATAYATIPVATAAAGCGSAYEVGATIACDSDSSSRSGTLLLRLNGDIATGDGYGVTLTFASDVLTLKIRKLTSGTWSTLTSVDVSAEANLISSSYDSIIQRLIGRIYDQEGVVLIEALFENEQKPRLSWTDQTYPLWRAAGTTGIYFEDNDNGVNGHIFVDSFALASLSETDDDHLPSVPLYTFGDAKKIVKERCLRDSSSSMSDSTFGDYLNEAIKELCAKVPSAWWWEETYDFQVAASQTEIMLPSKFRLCDDFVYDGTSNRPIPIVRERDYRSTRTQYNLTVVGSVLGFRLAGRSPMGGILLKPYPTPASSANYSITAWRSPRVMTRDEDVPDLPEDLQPGWIWAAVSLYALKDSDRTHAVLSENKKKEWVLDAIRLHNRFQSQTAPQAARSAFRMPALMDRLFRRHL